MKNIGIIGCGNIVRTLTPTMKYKIVVLDDGEHGVTISEVLNTADMINKQFSKKVESATINKSTPFPYSRMPEFPDPILFEKHRETKRKTNLTLPKKRRKKKNK